MSRDEELTDSFVGDCAHTDDTRTQAGAVQKNCAPETEANPMAAMTTAVSADVGSKAADVGLSTGTSEISKLDSPLDLSNRHRLVRSASTGQGHIVLNEGTNLFAVPTNGKYAEALMHEAARKNGKHLTRMAVSDAKYWLQSNAERIGAITDIWYRVAPVPGGVEFDLGDKTHARVRVTANKVEIIASGSLTVFCRTAAMLPMPMPAEVGDVNLLKKYVNLHPVSFVLWLAWVTYTMATPKRSSAKFVILVLNSGEGTGKTFLAKLTLRLIDPSHVGVRRLHKSDKDFAVAALLAHVLAFDNIRSLSHDQADLFCISATGGYISGRALYTDGEQSVLSLHVAVILNGILNVIDQPDLAQRTLQLMMQILQEHQRRSEDEMEAELVADLPAIQRGLFDLIAKILEQLPNVKVTCPARMIDFSRWLAAMELVYGAPAGTFQEAYLDTLNQAQLDSVLDNPLASEVLKFAESLQVGGTWTGTPSELLIALNARVDLGTRASKGWPGNAISLSKRLVPVQTALRSQGVILELSRGKHRTITISWVAGFVRSFVTASNVAGGFNGY